MTIKRPSLKKIVRDLLYTQESIALITDIINYSSQTLQFTAFQDILSAMYKRIKLIDILIKQIKCIYLV